MMPEQPQPAQEFLLLCLPNCFPSYLMSTVDMVQTGTRRPRAGFAPAQRGHAPTLRCYREISHFPFL